MVLAVPTLYMFLELRVHQLGPAFERESKGFLYFQLS